MEVPGGSSITVTATALKGADVTASLGGTKVKLKQQSNFVQDENWHRSLTKPRISPSTAERYQFPRAPQRFSPSDASKYTQASTDSPPLRAARASASARLSRLPSRSLLSRTRQSIRQPKSPRILHLPRIPTLRRIRPSPPTQRSLRARAAASILTRRRCSPPTPTRAFRAGRRCAR